MCCLLFHSKVILAPQAKTSGQSGPDAGIQYFNLHSWMPADNCGHDRRRGRGIWNLMTIPVLNLSLPIFLHHCQSWFYSLAFMGEPFLAYTKSSNE